MTRLHYIGPEQPEQPLQPELHAPEQPPEHFPEHEEEHVPEHPEQPEHPPPQFDEQLPTQVEVQVPEQLVHDAEQPLEHVQLQLPPQSRRPGVHPANESAALNALAATCPATRAPVAYVASTLLTRSRMFFIEIAIRFL